MKLLCAFVVSLTVLVDSVFGAAVNLENKEALIDGHPVDYNKTQMIEETPSYKKHFLKIGDDSITITKYKDEDKMLVEVSGTATDGEKKNMKVMITKFSDKFEKNMKMDKFSDDFEKNMKMDKFSDVFEKNMKMMGMFPDDKEKNIKDVPANIYKFLEKQKNMNKNFDMFDFPFE